VWDRGRTESHGDAAANDAGDGADGPEGGVEVVAEEDVAEGVDCEKERPRVGAELHDADGADAVLEGRECEEEPYGLGDAVDGNGSGDELWREANAAAIDGRVQKYWVDGCKCECEQQHVLVDENDACHTRVLEKLPRGHDRLTGVLFAVGQMESLVLVSKRPKTGEGDGTQTSRTKIHVRIAALKPMKPVTNPGRA
jgi:hypothetical protein